VVSPPAPSRTGALGLGVGLLSVAVMAAEIVLTRLFSVVLWYHFAFFAISVALLGLGAGAAFVHARRARLLASTSPDVLCTGSLLTGVFILVLEIALLRASPDWLAPVALFASVTLKLVCLFALAALPFAAAGFVLSVVFMRYGAALHRLYAWDLGGAGLACVLVLPLLNRLGGPGALAVCAVLAASASVAFAAAEPLARGKRIAKNVLLTAGVLALSVGSATSGLLDVRFAKGLDLGHQPPETERWNSFSLVNVFAHWPFRGWGLSPTYRGPVAKQKGLVIDLNAFTPLNAFDGDFAAVAYTQHDLSALAFHLRGAPARQVCIIGAGGGKDVLAALAAGAEHVVGVEVNPAIVELVRGPYRDFTGDLYGRADVEIQIEDGRSFLRASERTFDVILISMVDTSAATAAGAFALAENGLYTTDAFDDFLSRLSHDGMLTVASVSLDGLAVGARLASLARAALRARGADAEHGVVVVETPWLGARGATMYNFVLKPSGFGAADLERLRATAQRLGFKITYAPDIKTQRKREALAIDRVLRAQDDEKLARDIASWPYDVSPVSDDRPFFFYQNRLRDAGRALLSMATTEMFGNGLIILIKVFVAALAMLALLIAWPLLSAARRPGASAGRARVAIDIGYVACVGLGFMFIEIALIQRTLSYLGQPTYTLTAVLLVLLLGGGLGSRLASGAPPATVSRVMLALVAYALALAFGFDAVADATARFSMLGRALTVAALLAPLGMLLGVPLPSALARVHARDAERIPWLWGINSAASVLGSITATMVSMSFGITVSLLAGIACYIAARALWPRLAAA
jgi:spermidine synthase